MDRIDIPIPAARERGRYFSRSVNTDFVVATDTAGTTSIDLYDEIGPWGVTARDFREQLKGAGDIVLRINSPGGSVFDGIAMYNDLLTHKGDVRVEVVGVAASAASIVAMAAKTITIAPSAFFMIHNSWSVAVGNRHDMEDTAGVLAKIDDAMARVYAARTGTGIRTIKQMMDDETWMTGKEAKEAGFATGLLDAAPDARARFDLSVFAAAPDALGWPDDTDDAPTTRRDVERALMQDAGWSRTKARAAMRACATTQPSTETAKQDAGVDALNRVAFALAAARASITNRKEG